MQCICVCEFMITDHMQILLGRYNRWYSELSLSKTGFWPTSLYNWTQWKFVRLIHGLFLKGLLTICQNVINCWLTDLFWYSTDKTECMYDLLKHSNKTYTRQSVLKCSYTLLFICRSMWAVAKCYLLHDITLLLYCMNGLLVLHV